MKYVLFVMLTTGAAPITPEHWMLTSAEFDDEAACASAIKTLQGVAKRTNVNAICLPKATKPAEPAKPAA